MYSESTTLSFFAVAKNGRYASRRVYVIFVRLTTHNILQISAGADNSFFIGLGVP